MAASGSEAEQPATATTAPAPSPAAVAAVSDVQVAIEGPEWPASSSDEELVSQPQPVRRAVASPKPIVKGAWLQPPKSGRPRK